LRISVTLQIHEQSLTTAPAQFSSERASAIGLRKPKRLLSKVSALL
jgi:hypothetical protein